LTAGSTLAAPYVQAASAPIKWRLQTYSGAPLGAHVIKPQIEAFNKAANGEMEIELYYADQLVPTSELFRALQNGTIDAVQSDDATMQSPVDISVFGGYFPFSTRYSLDLPVFTKEPIRSIADMRGKRVFGVPTAGRFLSRYGLIPVTVPWDDVEVALQTGELDGVAWCGFTEAYEVGWADICNYALLNNVTGAWCGSYFANSESWKKVPDHLKQLFLSTIDQSHYYRQVWYWGGEAKLRVEGKKMELTTIPKEEWDTVVKDAEGFWDEIAEKSPRCKKVVETFKQYSAVMEKAGVPYRY
jgi:TRAP-type mannitol/chloroaromatic compound transport system substrate-binding protein